MQWSGNDERQRESVRKTVWLLLGVALNTLELFLPRVPFLPWLKPGLANSITMLWIIRFGVTDALLYTVIRVWIASFYFGFSLVTVSLALSGGLLATAAMGIAWRIAGGRNLLGTVGLGIIGAMMHNIGQLGAVYLLLTRNSAILYQIPFMGGAALLFGSFIGIITPALGRLLTADESILNRTQAPKHHDGNLPPPMMAIGTVLMIIAGSAALTVINDLRLLGGIAAAVTLVAYGTCGRRTETLFYPLRFWIMFLFISIVYLFFTYGIRISFLPFITYEGATATTAQFLRLWTWLEAGLLLTRLHCNRMLFMLLRKIFPSHAATLLAGLLSLEYFPDVLSFVKGREAREGIAWRNPVNGLVEFIRRVQNHIAGLISEDTLEGSS